VKSTLNLIFHHEKNFISRCFCSHQRFFIRSTKQNGKKDMKEMKMKEHVCTKACANGKHVYAHGEKGHVCTDACKKMK
jgi:hypothetical protein